MSLTAALKRILKVGTLEEAQAIADTALHWAKSFTSQVKCEYCPNMISWDTCARVEIRERTYNVCDECIERFNPSP